MTPLLQHASWTFEFRGLSARMLTEVERLHPRGRLRMKTVFDCDVCWYLEPQLSLRFPRCIYDAEWRKNKSLSPAGKSP